MIFLWEQSSETSEARREIQMPEIHENIQKNKYKNMKETLQ